MTHLRVPFAPDASTRGRIAARFVVCVVSILGGTSAHLHGQDVAVDPVEVGRSALKTVDPAWYDAEADALAPRSAAGDDPFRDAVDPGLRGSDWTGKPAPPKPSTSTAPPNLNFLQGLFQFFAAYGTTCVWSVIALALLAIIAGLIAFARYATFGREPGSPDADADAEETEAERAARMQSLPLEVRRNLGDLLGEADRLRGQGRYDQAIVCLYGHMLVTLDRRQMIRLLPGRTNRQYLRQLVGRPRLAEVLSRVVIAFEDSYFGGRPLGRERFEPLWASLSTFQAETA